MPPSLRPTQGPAAPPACPAGSPNLNADTLGNRNLCYFLTYFGCTTQTQPCPSCQKLQSSWLPFPDGLTEGQEEAGWHNWGESEQPCKEHGWSSGTQPAPTVSSTHSELFSVVTQTPVQRFQKGGSQGVRRCWWNSGCGETCNKQPPEPSPHQWDQSHSMQGKPSGKFYFSRNSIHGYQCSGVNSLFTFWTESVLIY